MEPGKNKQRKDKSIDVESAELDFGEVVPDRTDGQIDSDTNLKVQEIENVYG